MEYLIKFIFLVYVTLPAEVLFLTSVDTLLNILNPSDYFTYLQV
jgi:hypothetical protein